MRNNRRNSRGVVRAEIIPHPTEINLAQSFAVRPRGDLNGISGHGIRTSRG